MAQRKTSEEQSASKLKLELKEIVTIVTILASILFGYFGIVKDIETRLVKLETRMDIMDKDCYVPEPIRRDEGVRKDQPLENNKPLE